MANNIICDFFGVGYADAEYIQELIDSAVNANVDMDDAFDEFTELTRGADFSEMSTADFTNMIIIAIYDSIFYSFQRDLNDYLVDNGYESIETEFDLYVNCLDTHPAVIYDCDYDQRDSEIIDAYLNNQGDIESTIEESDVINDFLIKENEEEDMED